MLRAWFLLALLLVGRAAAQDPGLRIESREEGGRHTGEVFAVLERPFAEVSAALRDIRRWCEILTLPANVQQCSADGRLALHVARRPQDPPEDAQRVAFRYAVDGAAADELRIRLDAKSGPFGTRDYRMSVELAPLDARRSLIHMSYSYSLGFMARIAMDAYFATSGRDKVGFSVVDRLPDGTPVRVGGARGAVERNAMRYYLAVQAYLDSLEAPAPQRLETRLRRWFAAIQRYPQLEEEIGRDEYLELKRMQAGRRAEARLSADQAQ